VRSTILGTGPVNEKRSLTQLEPINGLPSRSLEAGCLNLDPSTTDRPGRKKDREMRSLFFGAQGGIDSLRSGLCPNASHCPSPLSAIAASNPPWRFIYLHVVALSVTYQHLAAN
jgi:hypothetical protein